MKLLRIALPVPLRRVFDYLPSTDLDMTVLIPGIRVRVPFQRRQLVGIFLGITSQTDIHPQKLRKIDEIIDTHPILSPEIMKLCLWAADYYHHPLGEVLYAALPARLRQGKPLPLVQTIREQRELAGTVVPLPLNEKQQIIVQAVSASMDTFSVVTIDGVTGSGKTEVYLQTIMPIIVQKKQVLVLVPEINLTPQLLERFRQRFSIPVVALHSGLTEKARLESWLAARSGGAWIVIGTRSAIFTPMMSLGLIIVDEEHDASFKQHDSFRYHARDLAILRARDANVPILLGSATPSLETLHRSWGGHYRYFELPERAGNAALPLFQIVDVRRLWLEEGLSEPLLQAIRTQLQAGNQVLLFLNRRGFSPILMCHACGWMAVCQHCDARMTYHLRPARLHCHHCEARVSVPLRCAQCGEKELNTRGMGTEQLEQVLQKIFPEMPLVRLDRDTTRHKGKIEEILSGIQSGHYRILIGTQMLAKGHHFPNVTLVGVVDSDDGLFSSDFRASERLGQLILQVAGRAGRAIKPGEVWIQTHHPEHPLIQLLKQGNYQAFAKSLLTERESAMLPPFSSLALFYAEARSAIAVENFLNRVKKIAFSFKHPITIRGPIAALMARRAGQYRMQLLLQASGKKSLQQFLQILLSEVEKSTMKPRVRWGIDVDPIEII